jgi:hypothetical protein
MARPWAALWISKGCSVDVIWWWWRRETWRSEALQRQQWGVQGTPLWRSTYGNRGTSGSDVFSVVPFGEWHFLLRLQLWDHLFLGSDASNDARGDTRGCSRRPYPPSGGRLPSFEGFAFSGWKSLIFLQLSDLAMTVHVGCFLCKTFSLGEPLIVVYVLCRILLDVPHCCLPSIAL